MFFQKVYAEWLAHYSYIFGDGYQAAVIDPRRDVDTYLQIAAAQGVQITHIFETHRHEDFVIGSVELAQRTGAQVHHAPEPGLEYRYGTPVQDGETFYIARLALRALHVPGHTLGHMGYLLHDPGGAAWVFFSGDTLFAGEVGRTDFFGVERMREMAGLLFDSLHQRILPLGDEVLLCPAHGAGSVCGSAISERLWTTIGLERKHNPRLQILERDTFIESVARVLGTPPYFALVERLNVEGAPVLEPFPLPTPLSPRQFRAEMVKAQVIDVREEPAFGAAHIPGAWSMYSRTLSNFTGWFLEPGTPILLVADEERLDAAVRQLVRLGYDHIAGYLSGGMPAWLQDGLEVAAIPVIQPAGLKHRIYGGEDAWFLDVRREEEKAGQGVLQVPHVQSIVLSAILQRAAEVPRQRPVYVICRTSARAMLAASLLEPLGYNNLNVVAGGVAGWFAN